MPSDGEGGVQRTSTVLVEGGTFRGRLRLIKGIVFVFAKQRATDERKLFVQNGYIARRFNVLRGDIGKPGFVIGYSRADAFAIFGQPPVLYIALKELPACSTQEMRADT